MNKVKPGSNMYQGWVTHTWSPMRGCPYQCNYCWVRDFGGQPETITLNQNILREDLGRGNKIFVCHMADMFAADVPDYMVNAVIVHCLKYPNNEYIFQTKNPGRLESVMDLLPRQSTIGITIETNRISSRISQAPDPIKRITNFLDFKLFAATRTNAIFSMSEQWQYFLTIEPIMKFDLEPLMAMIQVIKPDFVNIGADSKHHNLPEPTYAEVLDLIERIKKAGVVIKIKSNLARLAKVS